MILFFLGAGLASFSDGLVWPFAERIGTSLGLDEQVIGVLLAASFLSGLVGTWLSGRFGERFGHLIPVAAALLGTAVAGVALSHASSGATLLAGSVGKNVTIFLLLPYLLSAAAKLDRRGRAAAITGGILPVGFGLRAVGRGAVIESSASASRGGGGSSSRA